MGIRRKHRAIARLLVAGALVATALVAASPAAAQEVEWGGEDDKVREDDLGPFNGARLEYELRTQFASLRSSHARLKLMWRDKWAGEDVEQELFEEERAARLEEYELELIRGKATVKVTYPCPKTRKDRSTKCTEVWEWQKNSRRFALVEESSKTPKDKGLEHVAKLIRRGDLDGARAELEAAREAGQDVDSDELFGLYWAEIIDRAADKARQGKSGREQAREILTGFLRRAPVRAGARCPGGDKIEVCLKDKVECGCSDPFGQVAPDQAWSKRYSQLAKALGKIEDHELTERLLEPALAALPKNTEVALAMADVYWDTERKYKARPLYARVRKRRLADKTYIPNRVFERFKAPKDGEGGAPRR